MSDGEAWMAWAVVLPLAGAISTTLFGRHGPLLGLFASLATAGAAATVAWKVHTYGALLYAVGGWRAPLGIELRADGAASLLLLAFGVVFALVNVAALEHFPAGPRRGGFVALWLFAWAALDALLLSADVFNAYVALELLTLTSVGLLSLADSRSALSSALQYLLVALLGSLGYLLGVALLYATHATLDVELLARRVVPTPITLAAFALITAGLGLKAALFPLHGWLPPAYANASSPVSALLSGLVGKAPFVVLFRIWPAIFPAVLGSAAAQLVGAVGGAGIIWCSLVALRQRRLRVLLAYSSLAHVGYLFLFFPLATPTARAGAVYLAISHAVASAAMFLAAGTIERVVGSDALEALKGVAHRRPVTFAALGLAGVNLIGLPPSGGFIAKWLLVRASLESGQWWWAVLALAGGLIGAAYVFRILRSAFLSPPPEPHVHSVARGSERVSFALALVALALGLAPSWPLALLEVGQP